MVEETKKDEPEKEELETKDSNEEEDKFQPEPESRRGDFTSLGLPQLEEEAQARKLNFAGKTRSQIIDEILKYDSLSTEEQEAKQSEPNVRVEVGGGGIRGDEVDVVDKNGQYIRTYCKETHGAGFMKLAQEFIKVIPITPDENKGRQLVPHNPKVKEAAVIDARGETRNTFSKDVHGIHFREMALTIKSLPEMVTNNKGERVERVDRTFPVHIEYR